MRASVCDYTGRTWYVNDRVWPADSFAKNGATELTLSFINADGTVRLAHGALGYQFTATTPRLELSRHATADEWPIAAGTYPFAGEPVK